MTAEQTVDPGQPLHAQETPWQRLDRRTVWSSGVLLTGVMLGPAGVPTFLGLTQTNLPIALLLAIIIGGSVLVGAVVALVEVVRVARITFRVTDERVELRSNIVSQKYLSIPRDRVRSVDLTADVVQRVFGLVKVTVGTGQHIGGESNLLKLEAVSVAEGERLRALLLRRAPQPGGAGTAAAEGTTAQPAGAPIAAMNWGWLRYAPLTGLTLGLGFAAVGGGYGLLENAGLNEAVNDLAVATYRSWPLGWLIVAFLLALLVVGVIGTLGLAVEGWWNFRLEREAGGRLRVHRGLLTTRSMTLEERRLRGVEMREPIAMRLAGGASLRAVASGLKSKREDGKTEDRSDLLPPSPRELVDRTAATVLQQDTSPLAEVGLRAHPRAALRRRVVRALAVVVLLGAVLAWLGAAISWVPGWLWWVAVVVSLPLALFKAFHTYHNLGHGLTGPYLVTRYGGFRRDTVALQRSGVIGWTVKQTLFQRRLGLLTLTATTAAGSGGYKVIDADADEGLAFAETAVPGLLTPFLERG